MAIPRTLARHLKDVILHEAATSGDGFAAGGYAAAKQVMGRVESAVGPVRAHNGTETVSSAILYLREAYTDGTPLVAIGVSDRFTLPAGHLPQQPPIVRVDRNSHDGGLYAWKVTV